VTEGGRSLRVSSKQDKGCDLADSCLSCPFPKCVYEQRGGKQHFLKQQRSKEIVRLFTAEGKSVKELAQIFGFCERTIQRVLREEREGIRKKYGLRGW